MGRFLELTVRAAKSLVLITTLITHGASLQASDANGGTFDYVIVGGGLSGLVVANRLSADPKSASHPLSLALCL
jgi:ribulose 1,5-bisphosphate synthetase/thiazole synthase